MSEMPIEEEEEEDIDEDASMDGLEDVENFINEDDESDFTLDENDVREMLATGMETQPTRNFTRRDFVEGLGTRRSRRRPPRRGYSARKWRS